MSEFEFEENDSTQQQIFVHTCANVEIAYLRRYPRIKNSLREKKIRQEIFIM